MYVRQVISDPKARLKPCLRCQRSLLKHLDDRYCPDCGLSVWMSLNSNDALDRSRASWLRGAAQGAWILAAAQPIALAAYLIAMLGQQLPALRAAFESDAGWADDAALATMPTGRSINPTSLPSMQMMEAVRQPSTAIAIALCLMGAYFIVSAAGLVRLAVDERRYPDRQRTVRSAAHAAVGLAAIAGAAAFALGVTHLHNGWPTTSGTSWLVLIAIELTFGAVAICQWLYLRPIARRGGRSGLAKLCGYLLFLPLLTFAKAAPFIGLWFLYLLMPLATLIPLAYLPLSTVLFIKFARMLSAAAPHAQAAWDAESKPTEVATGT